MVSHMNRNKILLTNDVIKQTLNRDNSNPKKAWGIVLCILALFASEGALFSLVLGQIVWSIVLALLAVWLWKSAVKNIRLGKKYKEYTLTNQYRIVQTTCISLTKEVNEDSDGYSETHTSVFLNGESVQRSYPVAAVGDTVYLVYLPGSAKANAIFNANFYVPATDLFIERQ